ncbi:unnamed protein product, partial [Rhizophagus irregularis]
MSPDGFERPVWSVNGQHPGPLIQANKGDRLVLNVTNNFDDPATVHWHGMFQHGTNWYDGVPGQTQLQTESTWYLLVSLYFFAQYVDGLRGSLVVHDPDDPYLNQYDFEYLVVLSDWHHNTTGVLLPLQDAPGYSGLRPIPDSPLISGL